MNQLITTAQPKDEKERKLLQNSLKAKKQKLALLVTELEALQMELDVIQHEYNVRIGSLLLQDNELDLQIIKLKNIQELMRKGLTYQQAVNQIEGHFYSEILRVQKEQEEIEEERKIAEAVPEVSEETEEELKALWKKLIRSFHPDLTTNPEDKTHREELMKKINYAYTMRDLSTLQVLATNAKTPDIKKASFELLEQMLLDTENMTVSVIHTLWALKRSQWNHWKSEVTKGKKTGKDVFGSLEKSLTDDVLSKIATLRTLKEEVEPKTASNLNQSSN